MSINSGTVKLLLPPQHSRGISPGGLDEHPFVLIGVDGGLLPSPQGMETILLLPENALLASKPPEAKRERSQALSQTTPVGFD